MSCLDLLDVGNARPDVNPATDLDEDRALRSSDVTRRSSTIRGRKMADDPRIWGVAARISSEFRS